MFTEHRDDMVAAVMDASGRIGRDGEAATVADASRIFDPRLDGILNADAGAGQTSVSPG